MPSIIYVVGNEYINWENHINNVKNFDSVQIILFLIPGSKGKSLLYNELKRYSLCTLQCPSQIILTETITKGKNIKTIMNRLFIQIVAKISGEPWTINDIPFTDMPTIVCGIDSYDKGTCKLMGICSSINKNFSRYASVCFERKPTDEENIKFALNLAFKNVFI